MNTIIDPVSNKRYYLNSKQGKHLLKSFIRTYKNGGGLFDFLKPFCHWKFCDWDHLP